MTKKLIVPLDGSELSERALGWAELLARARGLIVRLVRVVYGQSYSTELGAHAERRHVPPGWKEAASYLAEVKRRLDASGIPVETEVREGLAGASIAEAAAEADAFAIVMATHARSGVGRLLLGSVADEVRREAEVPVLIVPREPDARRPAPGLSVIVVPLDGSELAEAALPFALELATGETKLVLVQVVAPIFGPVGIGGYTELVVDEDATRAREAEAEVYLDGVAQRLRDAGVKADLKVAAGPASDRILDVARSVSADLIVMTTHGYTGWRRWQTGSVADEVLRAQEYPVFLVTPRVVVAGAPEHRPVSHVMREDLLLLRPDEPLRSAAARMVAHRAASAAVVNPAGELVGVLSARDVLAALARHSEGLIADAEGSTSPLQQAVADVLPEAMTTVNEEATLAAAAQTLLDEHLEAVIVTKDHRPVGIATVHDLLAGLGQDQEKRPGIATVSR